MIFQNNVMSTYNVIEAAERAGVSRVVHLSSETVPGFCYPTRPCHADFAPIDESHRVAPQDSYALSKSVGEALMDAAVARRDMIGLSIRPLVQWEGNIERNLAPWSAPEVTTRAPRFGPTSSSTTLPTCSPSP